jgi:hypothetical protein
VHTFAVIQNAFNEQYVEELMSGEADGVEDVKALAETYRRVVQGSNRGHYVAAERADARGRMLGIASALLGAVVGTSIFATVQSSPSVDWRITAGILVTGAALLGALLVISMNWGSNRR